jgi:glycosyltransferase involved in cell wall biosynthesis
MTSDVSVIITCYNEGDYIEAALSSVLAQTCSNRIQQIVVADDGSDTRTIDVLKRLEKIDPRVRILYNCENGVAKNRNVAVSRTGSQWIAFLDGDDLWLPDRLKRQLAAAERHPNAGLIYTGFSLFRDGELDHELVARVYDFTHSSDTVHDFFLYDGPIIPSSMLVRRRAFENVNGFDATIRIFEDTEFCARLAAVTPFVLVPESLVRKRIHHHAVTSHRSNIIAHHALVTFIIATRHPRLLRYVRSRMGRFARRLGNVEASEGSSEKAADFYRLALTMSSWDLHAHACLFALRAGLPLGEIRRWLLSWRGRRHTPSGALERI